MEERKKKKEGKNRREVRKWKTEWKRQYQDESVEAGGVGRERRRA